MNAMTDLDMIVALTEKTLNDQIWSLYTLPLHPELDPDDPSYDYVISHKIDTRRRPGGPGIVATVGNQPEGLAPTVQIAFPDTNRRSLLFHLPLTAGHFSYFDTETGDLLTVDFDRWDLQFVVALKMEPIGAAALPAKVAATAASAATASLPFSDEYFSINKLLLDFENANYATLDLKGSSISANDPNTQAPIEDPLAMTTMIATITTYFKNLAKTNNPYILGYPIHPRDPRQAAANPLFEPTTVPPQLSSTPYIGDASHNELSTLNFLMMTRGRAFPSDTNTGLFNRNWVAPSATPGDVTQGVMVVSNELFTNSYLDQVLIPAIHESLSNAVGIALPRSRNGNSWTLLYNNVVKKEVAGSDSGILNIYRDTTTEIRCDLSFSPETRKITGSGYFYKYAYYYETPFVKPDGIWVADLTVKLSWTLEIALSCVDGRILLNPSVAQSGPIYKQFNENDFQKFGDMLGGNVSSIEGNMGGQYSRFANTALGRLQSNLAAGLNALQYRLIMPGGSVFSFKDLSFNDEQDMVVTLTYQDDAAGTPGAAQAPAASTVEVVAGHHW